MLTFEEAGKLVAEAMREQVPLEVAYVRVDGRASIREILPVGPFVENPNETFTFCAADKLIARLNARTGEIQNPQADLDRDVSTFRLERFIFARKKEGAKPLRNSQAQKHWAKLLGKGKKGTVYFPTIKNHIPDGKVPDPVFVPAGQDASQYQNEQWATVPQTGLIKRRVLTAEELAEAAARAIRAL